MGITYVVTPEGKVYSESNWRGYGVRELHQTLNSDGYPSVRMIINGKRTRIAVHVLVGKKFVSGYKDGLQLRHLDGNKLNSHYTNLKWGTAKQNADDREKHGRTSIGKKHSSAIKKGLAKKEGRFHES